LDQILQIGIALAIGATILMVGRWGINVLAAGGPPDVDPEDVVDVDIPFLCVVCGMQLTITYASADEVTAPRHCHEPMERV
jgi:hypothetical protein